MTACCVIVATVCLVFVVVPPWLPTHTHTVRQIRVGDERARTSWTAADFVFANESVLGGAVAPAATATVAVAVAVAASCDFN